MKVREVIAMLENKDIEAEVSLTLDGLEYDIIDEFVYTADSSDDVILVIKAH